jgi:AcrR family transcriptional regulator
MSDVSIPVDQTGSREKLLLAAIKLFSRDGFDATSVRAVAEEAGLSWGLVRFYFGSKDGLREAAEKRAMSEYLQKVREANSVTSSAELEAMIETQSEELTLAARFLRRMIMEERPIAMEFLRELLATTEGLLAKVRERFPDEPGFWDPVRAVAHRIGYVMLGPQLGMLSGRDLFSKEEIRRRNLQDGRMRHLAQLALEAGLGDATDP